MGVDLIGGQGGNRVLMFFFHAEDSIQAPLWSLALANGYMKQLNRKLSRINRKLRRLNKKGSQRNRKLSRLNRKLSRLNRKASRLNSCFIYTSDAADDLTGDYAGGRAGKKKNTIPQDTIGPH